MGLRLPTANALARKPHAQPEAPRLTEYPVVVTSAVAQPDAVVPAGQHGRDEEVYLGQRHPGAARQRLVNRSDSRFERITAVPVMERQPVVRDTGIDNSGTARCRVLSQIVRIKLRLMRQIAGDDGCSIPSLPSAQQCQGLCFRRSSLGERKVIPQPAQGFAGGGFVREYHDIADHVAALTNLSPTRAPVSASVFTLKQRAVPRGFMLAQCPERKGVARGTADE